MKHRLTVVPILTLSYTGSTWVTMILGSHEAALSIGPAKRLAETDPEKLRSICKLHREDCPFWPSFMRTWNRRKNLFVQLAEYSGKRIIIPYNPRPDMIKKELKPRLFRVQPLKVVRDGRGTLTSLIRHFPDRYPTFYDAVNMWYRPALEKILATTIRGTDDPLLLRYEDLVMSPFETLERIGDVLGITYPENALRFWEFERHPVGGNGGLISLLARFQAARDISPRRAGFYDHAFAELSAHPDKPVFDETWKQVLTREDRFVHDYVCGEIHAALGYERDTFTDEEASAFRAQLGLPENPADRPETLSVSVAADTNLIEQFSAS